ncbi:(2Fe-2S)-binding protein [Phenylobacterium sp.]|uniref:(2Fe-2S)-binding protein n=1 Tax=Phenylobacterium sp. TaxID=1871053 RepID=UPI002ED9A9D5
MRQAVEFKLNGSPVRVEAAADATLLDVLRGDLGVSGARYGCGLGQCGACVVLVDGRPETACALSAEAVAGRTVTSVEGLGTPERPHPLQTAFLDLQAGQCGYCLSGILVAAKALLDRNPDPDRQQIARALDAHLCRCGVHNRILDAVALAARRMREGAAA